MRPGRPAHRYQPRRGRRELPADYVRSRLSSAYATTAHGVQGDTVTAAHVVVGEHTGAASAYVGMTRGRTTTSPMSSPPTSTMPASSGSACSPATAPILDPRTPAYSAAREAADYTQARPLDQVLSELREAWTQQADQQHEVQRATAVRARLEQVVALRAQRDQAVAVLDHRHQQAQAVVEQARAKAGPLRRAPSTGTPTRYVTGCDGVGAHGAGREAARVVLAGPGPARAPAWAGSTGATETLARWSITWQPYLPDMPSRTAAIARYAS